MGKVKTKFICTACGTEALKWMGKCPGCGAWNTMQEEVIPAVNFQGDSYRQFDKKEKIQAIIDIHTGEEIRIQTSLSELNRVLGGGLVPGSLLLVGGDPGIGKSTLLLQTSQALSNCGLKVLYISGEESAQQTKLRADRLGVQTKDLYVFCETNLDFICEAIKQIDPDFLVIDSIQTVYKASIPSAPGSVAQVRECTAQFMRMAKINTVATVLVGHVTKEGAIAGPRMLEHMVDCVLYFEGERHHTYRMLRAVKNRFGSTNEIGIFDMTATGLTEVTNPSELFLSERPLGVSGSTVGVSMEGTRPLLVELQALVTPTHFPSPRRMAAGLDHHRISLIIAVLEKRMNLFMQNQDVYLNVAGGVKLDEPATDLAVAVSLASSLLDKPSQPYDAFFGEIGLTGEVRGVPRAEQRVKEAHMLGFQRIFMPEISRKGWQAPKGVDLIGVKSVAQVLEIALE